MNTLRYLLITDLALHTLTIDEFNSTNCTI